MSGPPLPTPIDPGPFDLGKGRDAVLCLHGLTGTPYEVRSIGQALADHGLRAVGPWLAGHDAGPEPLARTSHLDWIAGARAHYRELRAQHGRVFVAGLSLGGLLALGLAAEERVPALAVVGTPLRLHAPLARLIPWLKHWIRFAPKRRGSDIRDGAARAGHPGLGVMPLAAAHELMRLQRRVDAQLGRITAPILVAHGQLDRTADPGDARRLAGRVASAERELLWLPNSGHVVPVDHDAPALGRAIAKFLIRPRPSLR